MTSAAIIDTGVDDIVLKFQAQRKIPGYEDYVEYRHAKKGEHYVPQTWNKNLTIMIAPYNFSKVKVLVLFPL